MLLLHIFYTYQMYTDIDKKSDANVYYRILDRARFLQQQEIY